MKIVAGFQLKRRKPRVAPSSTAATIETQICPCKSASRVKKAQAIAATPAERPSMLSSRFMALQIAITQRMVAARLSQADGKKPTPTPPTKSSVAATACARSLTRGLKPALIVDDADDEQERGADEDDGSFLQHRSRIGDQRA